MFLKFFVPLFQAQEKVYAGIEIRDMGGAPNGLFNKGTAVVTLTDINDNPPTFKEKLVGSVYFLYGNITIHEINICLLCLNKHRFFKDIFT